VAAATSRVRRRVRRASVVELEERARRHGE
jgi:hypothetical protein